MLKSFMKENEAIGLLLGFGLLALGFGIMLVIAVIVVTSMVVQNVLPICIGIVIVIVLPILAKAYYAKQTGHEYPSQQRGDRGQ